MRGINKGSTERQCGQVSSNQSSTGTGERFHPWNEKRGWCWISDASAGRPSCFWAALLCCHLVQEQLAAQPIGSSVWDWIDGNIRGAHMPAPGKIYSMQQNRGEVKNEETQGCVSVCVSCEWFVEPTASGCADSVILLG